MDEDKKNSGTLNSLAEVADTLQSLYRGQITVILELDRFDYDKAIRGFDQVDLRNDKFKIDISGTEFIYILKSEE
jgi:hypothetical protein